MPRLTVADLAAIEAREQQVSPGPWYPWHRCSGVEETADLDEVAGLGWDIVVNRDTGERAWPEPQYRGTFERGHDAYFVAHARQDVPALLAEVWRLREVLRSIAQLPQIDPRDLGPGADAWLDEAKTMARAALAQEALGEEATE